MGEDNKPIDDQQRASAQSRQGCLQCPRGRQALLSAPQALPASLQAGGQRAAIPAPGPARRRLVAGNRSRAGNPLQYPSPPSTGPCSPGACPLTQGNICGAGASPTGGKRGRMAGGVSGTAFPSSFVPGSPAAA